MLTAASVKVFGCRPRDGGAARTGPASANLQGRKPREGDVEGDTGAAAGDQPAVGNGDAVGIARQDRPARPAARRTGAWHTRPTRLGEAGPDTPRMPAHRRRLHDRRRTSDGRLCGPRSASPGTAAGTGARARAPAGKGFISLVDLNDGARCAVEQLFE